MKTRRKKDTPLSVKAKVIGGVIGGVLAWQTLLISRAAERHDQVTDVSAIGTNPFLSSAVMSTADQRSGDDKTLDARAAAQRALTISPVSSEALRQLGFAEQRLGNVQQSSAILSQAAALGWRDEPTQLWLAAAYLHAKDFPDAAERLDAALRTDPSSTVMFDVLDQLIVDRRLAYAMVGRMALAPMWRSRYLGYVGTSTRDAAPTRALLISELVHSSAPPSRSESLAVVTTLIQEGRAVEARNLWLAVQHASGSLYDPEFEHVMTSGASPFEWNKLPVLGASTMTASDTGMDKGINVSTDGSAAGILLRQLVTLAPGRHAIDYVPVPPAPAQNAFGWQVRCTSGPPLVSTIGEAPLPARFLIPDGCTSQFIELRVVGDPGVAGIKVSFNRLRVR